MLTPSPADLAERRRWFHDFVANRDLSKGTVLITDMLEGKRPESGVSPEHLDLFIGRTLRRDLVYNEAISWDDVLASIPRARATAVHCAMRDAQQSVPGELRLRRADPSDTRLIWEWRNDPSVRANAFSHDPVPWDTHRMWLADKLASADCRIWILECDGRPVGQIRCEREGQLPRFTTRLTTAHEGEGWAHHSLRWPSR